MGAIALTLACSVYVAHSRRVLVPLERLQDPTHVEHQDGLSRRWVRVGAPIKELVTCLVQRSDFTSGWQQCCGIGNFATKNACCVSLKLHTGESEKAEATALPQNMRKHMLARFEWGLDKVKVRKKDKSACILLDFLLRSYANDDAVTGSASWRKRLHADVDVLAQAIRFNSTFSSLLAERGWLDDHCNIDVVQEMVLSAKSQRALAQGVYRTIASHHKSLVGEPTQYERFTRSNAALEKYASAATYMGNRRWVRASLEWMEQRMLHFFTGGGARRAEMKSLRKRGLNSIPESVKSIPDNLIGARKIKLLDVGSCHNPFAKCKSRHALDVMALDLKPAAEGVYQCDFFDVGTVAQGCQPVLDPTMQKLLKLPVNTYDVVTISLVLSYLPSPMQRVEMVKRARQLLRKPLDAKSSYDTGLLLIMDTPATLGCQNQELLGLWKSEIAAIGFELIAYQLLTLKGSGEGDYKSHVFAFRVAEKSCNASRTSSPGLPLKREFKKKQVASFISSPS